MRDYYDILKIEKTANPSKIKSQFWKLSKEFHPLESKDNSIKQIEIFVSVIEAYEILSDENGKKIYDFIINSNKTLNDFINGCHSKIWTSYAKSLSAKIINANKKGLGYSKENYSQLKEDYSDFNWWDIINGIPIP